MRTERVQELPDTASVTSRRILIEFPMLIVDMAVLVVRESGRFHVLPFQSPRTTPIEFSVLWCALYYKVKSRKFISVRIRQIFRRLC